MCVTAVCLAIGAPRAGATPIELSVLVGPEIQQTENRPCVIGDPSCHNAASFPYTLIPPQMGSGTLTSPVYTVAMLRHALGGDTFSVGLDLNQAMGQNGGMFKLMSFSLAVDGVTRFSTSGPTVLTPVRFGNGFSDASIAMFNLSGLGDDQNLVFTAAFKGGTAGREQFFLTPTDNGPGAPIPEPATVLLVGSALAALAAKRRRRTPNPDVTA